MAFEKPLTAEEIKERMREAQQRQAVGEFEKFAEEKLAKMTPEEREVFMKGREGERKRRIAGGK